MSAAQPFMDIGAGLPGVDYASARWGDYDNDGDLDILLAGDTHAGLLARVYRNEGGVFTDMGAALTGVYASALAWGDYDGDGDLDILLTGWVTGPFTRLYRNDDGAFTEIGVALPAVTSASVAWGDYDNDGDLDILLVGSPDGVSAIARVYRNDGAGVFTDIGAALAGAYWSSAAWGDYDNDGDLDILLAGDGGSGRIARLYRNDGGVFPEIGVGLPGVDYSGVAWGDYDNDGDLDFLFTGSSSSGLVARIYRNDGVVFTDIVAGLPPVYAGSVAWGDYDNDGDFDILLTGYSGSVGVASVYRNDTGGVFTDIGAGLPGVWVSSASWGDYDNDGDLDILLAGWDGGATVARVYRNDTPVPNSVPNAPANLGSVVGGLQATLSWNAANDSQTPTPGLTYNLRVGTSPGAGDVAPPMAAGNGYRRLPALGGAQHGTTAVVQSLVPGTYYWSVQAVDTAFAGSPFAGEGSFVVEPCSYAIDPVNVAVGPEGVTATAAVATGAGCPWTAVSNDAWITVTGGSSGSGNGTVSYSVAENPGGARSGTITIAELTFTVNQAALQALSIDDVTVTEGNSGPVNASFTVSLSAASTRTVTVHFTTVDGEAVAPGDYTALSGDVTFSPGDLTRPVVVEVQGDLLDEVEEHFSVQLSAPVNALIGRGTGVGTIQDDENALLQAAALVLTPLAQGVLKAGDTVEVQPAWRNAGAGATAFLTGSATASNGGTIVDGAASYGIVGIGATASCTAESDCYSLTVGGARPGQHWDVLMPEALSENASHDWLLHVGDSFTDVPRTNGFFRFVETIYHKGVTGGCGTDTYCPGNSATREQMAVFVLVAKEGSSYSPPACAPPNLFTDVPETSPFCKWIEELANRGVAGGCGPNLYCPGNAVTREQMAVFVLRTLDPTLNPPACSPPNLFNDVPETSPFCKWIEELANRGVVSGCGEGNYCPTGPVTREQMAVFLAATFGLALYGP